MIDTLLKQPAGKSKVLKLRPPLFHVLYFDYKTIKSSNFTTKQI